MGSTIQSPRENRVTDHTPHQHIHQLCDRLTDHISNSHAGQNDQALHETKRLCFEIRSVTTSPQIAQYTRDLESAASRYFSGSPLKSINAQDRHKAAYSLPQRIREHADWLLAEGELK